MLKAVWDSNRSPLRIPPTFITAPVKLCLQYGFAPYKKIFKHWVGEQDEFQ